MTDWELLALCARSTSVLLGIWVLLTTLEWFSASDLFLPGHLLGWGVLRLRSRSYGRAWVGALMSPGAVRYVLGFRAAAGIGLIVSPTPFAVLVGLGVVFATSCLLTLRACMGFDGSDQMGSILTAGLFLVCSGQLLHDWTVAIAGVVLISVQCSLSYFVAGVAKLVSPAWRRGDAMRMVMSAQTYGNRAVADLLSARPRMGLALCWGVMTAEVVFPLAGMGPPRLALVGLSVFAAFHAANAATMGLNAFLWAFFAAYPSVLFLSWLVWR